MRADYRTTSLDVVVLNNLQLVLEEDFIDVLILFKNNTPILIETIRTALVEKDFPSAIIATHTIKGSSSNLGLVRLEDLCLHYEDMLRGSIDAEQFQRHFDIISIEYVTAQAMLDDYMS